MDSLDSTLADLTARFDAALAAASDMRALDEVRVRSAGGAEQLRIDLILAILDELDHSGRIRSNRL